MAKKSITKVRESMIKQLIEMGANVAHYENLIDDYCYYEQQEKKMQADVRRRGITYPATSAQGYDIEKENPAVKAAYMYNKQKLAILKEMNLTTKNVVTEDADEL